MRVHRMDDIGDEIQKALDCLRDRRLVIWCLTESELFCQDGLSWERSVENQGPPDRVQSTKEFHRNHWEPLLRKALEGEFPPPSEFGKELEWHYYPLEGVICHIMVNASVRMENNLRRIFVEIDGIGRSDLSPSPLIKDIPEEEFSRRISEYLEARHEEIKEECQRRPNDVAKAWRRYR